MKSLLILVFALSAGSGFAQSSDPAAPATVQVPEPKEPSKELPADIPPKGPAPKVSKKAKKVPAPPAVPQPPKPPAPPEEN